MKIMQKTIATAAAAGVLVGGGMAAPAYAQPQQDGLVNVVIDDSFNDLLDVTVEDVNVAVAVPIAVNACDLIDADVVAGVLGRATSVDRSGRSQTICENEQGSVTIEQN